MSEKDIHSLEHTKYRCQYHIVLPIVSSITLEHTYCSQGKMLIHLRFEYQSDRDCKKPGTYLRYHRAFQGISTRELAEKVNVVPATITLYENDRHPIKYTTAIALANTLGIERRRLLDEYTSFIDHPCCKLLKTVRKSLSMSQMQMSAEIGVAQTAYSKWERGAGNPRRQEYEKIMAAFTRLGVNIHAASVDEVICAV